MVARKPRRVCTLGLERAFTGSRKVCGIHCETVEKPNHTSRMASFRKNRLAFSNRTRPSVKVFSLFRQSLQTTCGVCQPELDERTGDKKEGRYRKRIPPPLVNLSSQVRPVRLYDRSRKLAWSCCWSLAPTPLSQQPTTFRTS